MSTMERTPFDEPLRRPSMELLDGEDLACANPVEAAHWLETYTELLRNEEWLLDDRLPVANILRVRLDRINRLRERQEFWRGRAEELSRAL